MSNEKAIAKNNAVNEPEIKPPIGSNSLFDGSVNKHKFAIFTELGRNDDGTTKIVGNEVRALFVEGDKTIESQWQTPFENSNPEHKLPTLMAGIQSGQILQSVGGIIANNAGVSKETSQAVGSATAGVADLVDPVAGQMKEALNSLVGRTNLTKVNSEQVFLSTAPIQLNLTIFFMAIKDAREEVELKIAQLEKWALPAELSEIGIIQSLDKEKSLTGLFPSKIPPYVSLTLNGKTYSPFIVQSVSSPLSAPIDSDGNRLSLQVTVTLMSRTAWGASDIDKLYGITTK